MDIQQEQNIDMTLNTVQDINVTITGVGGPKGADGREVELQTVSGAIQWRYLGTSQWNSLVEVADLKGDPGTGVNIVGSLDDVSELPSDPNEGDTYLIHGELYVHNGIEWMNVGSIEGPQGEQGIQGVQGEKGEKGDTGPGNTLSIGTVTTGTSAATITGTSPNQVLNLTLQKGDKGDRGEIGLTGSPGPKGDKGDKGDDGSQGIQGIQGPKGDDGDSAYQVWLDDGNTGTEADFLEAIKGDKGDQGDQGPKGDSGSGTGDMLASNNLSDVPNAATARTNLGIGNVDNTADANKPISSATQTALNNKVAGPVYATDNAIPVFNGSTGKVVKATGAVLDPVSGDFGTAGLVESNTIMGAPLVVADEISEYFNGAGILIEDVWIKGGLVNERNIAADGTKLDGVEVGATANNTDAYLRNRANHTGAQAISTVTGLQTAIDGKAASVHTHVATTDLTATGTKSSATYLRGDNTWATPTNTTYTAMSTAEGQTGTASTLRTIRADYLKAIVNYHIANALSQSVPTDVMFYR